ncbi:MAG TPA: F0F1 ATP synthase subunit delta [Povalibacter sp.]|uniref:F0F1 ATP synthase subunit delta n=1 Tax=Povalibacter sp. TaxID=1962978 RepID=UPI002B7E5DBD|nr:F0F1 ATP synthase subunit delta [Povalibacter sp.]HMN47007.1 F0F1 ATP synthase subunit delta [Povalibacter sp.]
MAEKITIARPYARAAFAYAQEHKAFAKWSELLGNGSTVVADERVARLLSSPRLTPSQLVDLVGEASGVTLDEHGKNFLDTLAQNRRLGLLPEIAAIYETLRAEVENIADVQITSAVALSDAQRERLSAALRKRMKREIRLHCDVDASLLGGAIVRSGDLVIDGSLKSGLDRLASELAH